MKGFKIFGCRALCFFLALILLTGCKSDGGKTFAPDRESPEPWAETLDSSGESIKCAVVYSPRHSDGTWEDVYSRLAQPLLANLLADGLPAEELEALSLYDIVYLDESVLSDEDFAGISDGIVSFVEGGGSLFLTNGFWDSFPREFIGASEFRKIEGYPSGLNFPELGADYGELQEIISDFSMLYEEFADFSRLEQYDYGYGLEPESAVSLVDHGALSLYSMNKYGEGLVFFTNPLLPNPHAISGFSLESRNETQESLSGTTAGCNQLLENAFASFVSKERYGFSLYRVFGSFGRPSMSWELHYEEITGIENDSALIFEELCREYGQIPSYTLARNPYKWFLRAETVSYLLGESAETPQYAMDYYENAYSSGAHVDAGGRWLSLASLDDTGSFFSDEDYGIRAYPYAADINGNGFMDILCGSSDGKFYFYAGTGFSSRLTTEAAMELTDKSGRPIQVSAGSAPVMWDVNGDGFSDIISGCSDGRIYWFSGDGSLNFEYEGLLLNANMYGQSFPDVGDYNADGIPDLVVGSNSGRLSVWFGTDPDMFSSLGPESGITLAEDHGSWLAPRLVDFDGDGVSDLLIGTSLGYIARYVYTPQGLAFDGYLSHEEMNYKGNLNVKFGECCVPFFADLDGDGILDILAGYTEYGMSYPLDSPSFPYSDQLRTTIDRIKSDELYLGLHFYTNDFASRKRELAELKYHRSAIEDYYSYPLDIAGVNHHTWHSSSFDMRQTFYSIWDSGFLWDSGFSTTNSALLEPHVNAQNVVALPFFLTRDGERTLLMQNCSTLLYAEEEWTDISAKYGMPVCIYYHCDFAYREEEEQRENIEAAEEFRRKHAYNFVREDQLMLQTAAAYNMFAGLSFSGEDGFTVTPSEISRDFPLHDERYQGACGLRISLGDALINEELSVDADVWYRRDGEIYLSLNRPVTVTTGAQPDVTHIRQINIPAEVDLYGSGAEIRFLDGGMMQVVAEGNVRIKDPGWSWEEYDGLTVFTKYGPAGTIDIDFY